jgi:hypothetical protein
MALRTGHGTGAGQPRVEVLPVDELPAGVPEGARGESPTDRGEAGRFARGNSLARRGGRARAGKTRLADRPICFVALAGDACEAPGVFANQDRRFARRGRSQDGRRRRTASAARSIARPKGAFRSLGARAPTAHAQPCPEVSAPVALASGATHSFSWLHSLGYAQSRTDAQLVRHVEPSQP